MLVMFTARAETVAERAQRLFNEGLALKDKGDSRACDRFEESYRLVAAAGTGYNLAECMEQQGKLLRAWQLYGAATLEWQRDDKDARAAKARERARALEQKLVTIVLDLDDPDVDQLSVTIGTRSVKPARRIRELADPGAIEVRAVAPGFAPFVRSIEADAGATQTLRIALQPIGNEQTLVETHRRRSRVLAAAGLGVLGVAGAISGTMLFIDARELQAAGDTSAQFRADLATGFGAGGAICIAAAVVVFITAPRDVTVTPVATTSSAGVVIGGIF